MESGSRKEASQDRRDLRCRVPLREYTMRGWTDSCAGSESLDPHEFQSARRIILVTSQIAVVVRATADIAAASYWWRAISWQVGHWEPLMDVGLLMSPTLPYANVRTAPSASVTVTELSGL